MYLDDFSCIKICNWIPAIEDGRRPVYRLVRFGGSCIELYVA